MRQVSHDECVKNDVELCPTMLSLPFKNSIMVRLNLPLLLLTCFWRRDTVHIPQNSEPAFAPLFSERFQYLGPLDRTRWARSFGADAG